MKPRLEDLNPEQLKITTMALSMLNKKKQMLILIHGPPESGKTTYVARAITNECIRSGIQTKLIAATGVAAAQEKGHTIHSFIRLPSFKIDWLIQFKPKQMSPTELFSYICIFTELFLLFMLCVFCVFVIN